MSSRKFVIEALLLAVYGQLLVPPRAVEYMMPYSSLMELYEIRESKEPIMPNPDDDAYVFKKIDELIQYFEMPFNKKKLDRTLQVPWQQSAPFPVSDQVVISVVFSVDNGEYGEVFDPIETELMLIALRNSVPLLTDQYELEDRIIDHEIPVQIFDIDDFDFAMELEEEM